MLTISSSFFRVFSLPCLMLGLMFFTASLTPSLIPRGPDVQGVLGGIVTALGYLLGQTIALLWRAADLPRLQGQLARVTTIAFVIPVCVLFVWTAAYSLEWQNDLRAKMGLAPEDGLHLVVICVTAIASFALCFLIGAVIAYGFRRIRALLYRVMPPRRANVLGVLSVALILFLGTRDGIFDRVVTSLDQSYETAQMLFDTAPPPPVDPDEPGGRNSLIGWAELGEPGRDFVTKGPDAAAISAFTGAPAKDPIRVYVGRANADTAEERAALGLAELQRLGAFDRAVLVVTSPTGTGWMDPGSHDPLEFMHGGDIATVAAQYSYLQSPLALILETNTGLEQATAMLKAIHVYWKTLPVDNRPRLYAHGLSLGAWSSMFATNLFRLVDDPIDGAFWAGPPFTSSFWKYAQNARETGSPWVLPTIDDGSLVRYASHYADASEAQAEWGNMRIVFLQYSSDPIVFYDPYSLWRAPVWMTEPAAPDASSHMRFVPIVTQFQLALDMALSFGAPPGHGHRYYARDYIAPWAQVTAPLDWSPEHAERLREYCTSNIKNGCVDE